MLQRRRTCGVWRKVRVAGRRPCSLLGAWARAARSVCGLWRARSALSPPGRRGSKAVYHCCVTITSEGSVYTPVPMLRECLGSVSSCTYFFFSGDS